MSQITREEGIETLTKAQKELAAATTKDEALAVLRGAGALVGYAPTFRCLVSGKEPEQSIRW